MYYRANITTVDECRSPALPEDLGYQVIVYGPDFAIVDTDYLGNHLPDGLQVVPQNLRRLLDSGRDYPPARALAVERLSIPASTTSPPVNASTTSCSKDS